MNYPRKKICELWRKYGHSYNMTNESTYVCHISLHMGERAGDYSFGPEDITIDELVRKHGLVEN